jgi:hypothetical protein
MDIVAPTSNIISMSPVSPSVAANSRAGAIDIRFTFEADKSDFKGEFYLYRRQSELESWTYITSIKINRAITANESMTVFTDYNVEQGNTYFYALSRVDTKNQIYSTKTPIGAAAANFEDAFLWDGKRQLCIKYNPKVTSFKPTLLENKIDTIGS